MDDIKIYLADWSIEFIPLMKWSLIWHVSTARIILGVTESVMTCSGTQCLFLNVFQAMTFVISPKISEFSSRAQKWKSENSKEARLDWNLRITSAFNSLLVFPISMYALSTELEWSDKFSSCYAAKLRLGFLTVSVQKPFSKSMNDVSKTKIFSPDQKLVKKRSDIKNIVAFVGENHEIFTF